MSRVEAYIARNPPPSRDQISEAFYQACEGDSNTLQSTFSIAARTSTGFRHGPKLHRWTVPENATVGSAVDRQQGVSSVGCSAEEQGPQPN
jgi:hypothetical protein